jgi:phenylalanine-4-hydroxylase
MVSRIYKHPLVTEEDWSHFTDEDHETWETLYRRQKRLLQNRVVIEVFDGMEKLHIAENKIPKFSDINAILKKETGFQLVAVKGLIPEDLFFAFLAERKFPSTCFIRRPEELDYLEEPDIFHDVFGHIPLLIHPIFADFMEEFGRKGLESIDKGLLKEASRLYWFTVEFGLINTLDGLRIYGSGITSSMGESVYSLESDVPKRIKYNTLRILKTQYHIDSYQKTYFVIDGYNQIFQALKNLNWDEVHDTCVRFPDIEQGITINKAEEL